MNARFSEIKNVELFATDQSIGKVVDLLIEDKNWKVRYLVIDILDSRDRDFESSPNFSSSDFKSRLGRSLDCLFARFAACKGKPDT